MRNIEIKIHNVTRDTLSKVNSDWWLNLVDERIRKMCESRVKNSKEHPFTHTILHDLQGIISQNWTYFKNDFSPAWLSKSEFNRAMSDLIPIRNKIMHPVRNELGLNEKFYLLIFERRINEISIS